MTAEADSRELTTIIPLTVATSTSMLSTHTPTRAITLSPLAGSNFPGDFGTASHHHRILLLSG